MWVLDRNVNSLCLHVFCFHLKLIIHYTMVLTNSSKDRRTAKQSRPKAYLGCRFTSVWFAFTFPFATRRAARPPLACPTNGPGWANSQDCPILNYEIILLQKTRYNFSNDENITLVENTVTQLLCSTQQTEHTSDIKKPDIKPLNDRDTQTLTVNPFLISEKKNA